MNSDANPTSEEEIRRVIKTYSNSLYKKCILLLCNKADAEDALQTTFLKYLSNSPEFQDFEHEKAWLFRVAINICNDILRKRKTTSHLNIEEVYDFSIAESNTYILSSVMNLPAKYKVVILLFYIDGYKTVEIAKLLKISPVAVRKRLQYGRKLLKLEYGEE